MKDYKTLWLHEKTKFIVVYHSCEKNTEGFFVGIADSIENANSIIEEDMRNVNGKKEQYGIIPCAENSLRAVCIKDVVEAQRNYDDPMDAFDEGVV